MKPYVYEKREYHDGGGIYAFYPYDSPYNKEGKGVFKIGMATSFNHRIGGYHTYLPQGMYVIAKLVDPTLKKKKMEKKPYLVKIENEIYKYVENHDGKMVTMDSRKNGGKTEWIYAKEAVIHDAFHDAFQKYAGKNTKIYEGELGRLKDFHREKGYPIFTGKTNFY